MATKTAVVFTKKALTLKAADEIASLAIKNAIDNCFKPISVCVLDSSGHEIVTKRMDDCPPGALSQIAFAKARGCISMSCSSRAYGKKYLFTKTGETPVTPDVFVRVVNQINISGGQVAAFPGGVLIRDKDGDVVGSIGVSGAAGDEDEYCGLMAVKEYGHELKTEPESHSCTTAKL
eukprot:CAMPEP_0118673408 /NCGR_PEP_ID=MMETSP0800-20121206/303_1 /TAXON_ID=210618 ORGANISM="Striatella unipunctata, Strain CCMP2910" /NCGR_SAMPLE_ID=MMETSP0800 /ASSEMBLY_ACC=CAM_ASM_000638 /LENGTH=176 /DNA_ID=CAMNT_0006568463 /DNA_START=15 /DNA_END=545 /DNA_ORIENTATION=+